MHAASETALQARDEAARWRYVAGALLAAGVLLRIALYFPIAAFPIDSDGVLAGLCAFHIGGGHYPAFFPGGARLSAASCYVAAGFFRIVGPGRAGLALTGLTWGVLYLVFTLLFLRAALGRRDGALAFVFAVVPTAAFVTVTYVPWAYGEIAASCACTLWLATRWREQGRPWQRLCFGISAGLGAWFSLQTLMIVLPAAIWIALRRKRPMLREAGLAAIGLAVGALPLIASNVAGGFPTFAHNWSVRPSSSVAQIGDNLAWLAASPLPQLLFYGIPRAWWTPSSAIVLAYALAAFGFALALRRRLRGPGASVDAKDAGVLVLLAFAATVLLYACSQAGSVRGWTVRYVAPFYAVLPLAFGIAVAALWRWRRWTAIACAAAFLIPNALLCNLPGTSARAVLAGELRVDRELLLRLAGARVRAVYGDYFTVYHLNFDSRETIAGIPTQERFDYLRYAAALPPDGLRFALLDDRRDRVMAWAARARARGTIKTVGNLTLFVAAAPAASTAALFAALRR